MAEFAIIKKSTLIAIADAIRTKHGISNDENDSNFILVPTSSMAEEILNIETGSDFSASTLQNGSQLLYPLTAYDSKGNLITGTIRTKTQNDLSVDGSQVKVPAGYYTELATKSVATTTQATPSISVDSNGLITASAIQSAGYVFAGTKSKTKQLSTQAAKTITPSTSSQTAVSSGKYTTGEIKVNPIPSQYIIPSGNLDITSNGIYDVKNYTSTTVSVPVTEAGNYITQLIRDGSNEYNIWFEIPSNKTYDEIFDDFKIAYVRMRSSTDAVLTIAFYRRGEEFLCDYTEMDWNSGNVVFADLRYVNAGIYNGKLKLSIETTTRYSYDDADKMGQAVF